MGAGFDPLAALRLLADRGVRYVLIGGYAGNLRGSELLTGDLDICYARDEENLVRLAEALEQVHATLRGRDVPPDLPFQLDVRTLRAGDTFTFDTDVGPLDILGTPSGTGGFVDLDVAASTVEVEDVAVRVASLDDLMRMKRASARPKDLLHLEHLAALREEIEELRSRGEDPQQGT
jgi:hypothetical protein